jgi:hypothetical protein
MTSAFEPILNEVMAEIQKQREELMRLHREMPEISGSARSKRRQVSVTVDARGDVVELTFHGTGYRSLAPNELSAVIVDTIREAKANASRQLWDAVGDIFPDAADLADLMSGDVDWTDALSPPKPLLDLLKPPAPAARAPEDVPGPVPVADSGRDNGEPARDDTGGTDDGERGTRP